MKDGTARGIKIYLGYFPFYPSYKKYRPLYRLAAEYNCPVIFHTGDVYGSEYFVKYAQPLHVDDAAVMFPKTTFVIAHLGAPWVVDAAEVIYKNSNVFADLSAFTLGGDYDQGDLKRVKDFIEYTVDYLGDDKKLMYGSDWPLVSMKAYIELIRKSTPKKLHQKVFYKNARNIFNFR